MDLFKNLIQPTIVHLGDDESLPIKNRYMLNYNVVQLDWFKNHSLVLEDDSGILLLENTDILNPYNAAINDANDTKSVLDLPRVFFDINSNFKTPDGIKTPNSINSFIITLLQLSDSEMLGPLAEFIIQGNEYEDNIPETEDKLIPGVDFFINKTFADYLINIQLGIDDDFDIISDEDKVKVDIIKSITLPNYLTEESYISRYWIQLTEDEKNNTDLAYYFDINRFSKFENKENSEQISNNFSAAFFQSILDANENKVISTPEQALQKTVLEFFANDKTDSTLQTMKLILDSSITSSSSGCCSCNSTSTSTSSSTCPDIYIGAMYQHLQNMFSNLNFYGEWFTLNDQDSDSENGSENGSGNGSGSDSGSGSGNGSGEGELNEDLIDFLRYINGKAYESITESQRKAASSSNACKRYGLKSVYTNNGNSNANSTSIAAAIAALSGSSTSNIASISPSSSSAPSVLKNFDKLLTTLLNGDVASNMNKIKLWGCQFAQLLPNINKI